MTWQPGELHKRLVALQSDEELERKAEKATERARIWTQEELDWCDRKAERLWRGLHQDYTSPWRLSGDRR